MKRHYSISLPAIALLITITFIMAQPGWTQTAKQTEQEKVFTDVSEAEYQKAIDTWAPQGWIVSQARVRVVRNKPLFTATMIKPAKTLKWLANHNLDDATYQRLKKENAAKGYTEYGHRVYFVNLKRKHISFWKIEPVAPTRDLFANFWPDNEPLPVSGASVDDFKPVDELMRKFVREQKIPGATIAISYQGKIVFSRGYGYANVEQKTPMRPESLMRIASLTKPITGAAIMRLVDQGKLKLDDPILDVLKIKPRDPDRLDPLWQKITIRHLLHHTAGFDRNMSGDPMFLPGKISRTLKIKMPFAPDSILQYMFLQPLDFEPGEKKVFSNFGYCLLGRVIESVSGKSYEEFVQTEILRPVGVTRMKIGKSLEQERARDEVTYYTRGGKKFRASVGDKVGQPAPLQYGVYSIENLDANGGWIAAAPDVLKFCIGFDNPARCPWMRKELFEETFRQPDYLKIEPNAQRQLRYHGIGWVVVEFPNGKKRSLHFGSLPGTNSVMVRRADGFSWAILFNCRKALQNKDAAIAIDADVYRAVNQSKKNAGIR